MPVEILARISCIHIRSLSNSSLGICVKTAVAIPWSFSSRAYPLQVLLSQRPRFGTGDWLIHEWCSPHWLLCWILRHSETFVIPSFLFPILRKKNSSKQLPPFHPDTASYCHGMFPAHPHIRTAAPGLPAMHSLIRITPFQHIRCHAVAVESSLPIAVTGNIQ